MLDGRVCEGVFVCMFGACGDRGGLMSCTPFGGRYLKLILDGDVIFLRLLQVEKTAECVSSLSGSKGSKLAILCIRFLRKEVSLS